MKQIHIDTKVLVLLVGFISPGVLLADEVPGSVVASDGVHSSGNNAHSEIERLRNDVVKGKADAQAISEQNSELSSRQKELESRILELKKKALDQSGDTSDSDALINK